MKITDEAIKELKRLTEEIAKNEGQSITGYITERSRMFMESNAKPHLADYDSILFSYESGSEVVEEDEINEETVEVHAPDMKWTVSEIKKYMDEKGIEFTKYDTKKVLLEKVNEVEQKAVEEEE